MKNERPFSIETVATIGGVQHQTCGAVNPPVYRASTIVFENTEALRASESSPLETLNYGRLGTPSTRAIEAAVAELENGFRAVAGPSGLSIITTVLLAYSQPKGHMLISRDAYKGVGRFCIEVLTKYDVEVEWYRPEVGVGIERLIRPNTCIIYAESPGSIELTVSDLPAMISAAKQHQVPVIVDNTWATPLYLQPLTLGADIVIHSASKYLCGHSDVLFGIAVCTASSWPVVKRMASVLGVHASSDDAYLALRGIRTLAVRMERHQASAIALARWLERQEEVDAVLYPALRSHPTHSIWLRDFAGASGRFAVKLKPLPAGVVDSLVDSLALFKLGFSWGGYESIIMPEYQVDAATGKTVSCCLRISVGLESVDDLLHDLKCGFDLLRRGHSSQKEYVGDQETLPLDKA